MAVKRQIIKENGKNAHFVEGQLPSSIQLLAFRQITSVKPSIEACRTQNRFGGSIQAEMASWDRPDVKNAGKGTIEKAFPLKGQKQQQKEKQKNFYSTATTNIGFSSPISNRVLTTTTINTQKQKKHFYSSSSSKLGFPSFSSKNILNNKNNWLQIFNYLIKESSSMGEEQVSENNKKIIIEKQKILNKNEEENNKIIQNGIIKQNGNNNKGEYDGFLFYYQRSRSHSPPWLGPKKKRCAPKLNTQERLFGPPAPETPKKKVINTHRSTIFDNSVPTSPARTPKKCVPIIERNPITGEIKIPKKYNNVRGRK
ncbi:hypothetical protein Mgra_00000507 [Meloidogyne graminicola]|uniref:Uncharacterized protein n=1 Tax=Meloidogyne graminicola TaxID=189291 RepID=A0A8T0A1T6_9BILA|nr:hypothetical protein Mgra_00000507 [Meloidogyne graminicola]